MKVLGRHIIAELHGCDPGLLTDLDRGIEILREAVRVSGATYLGEFHKVFEPWGGFTAIIALAESHISIHTWPEYRYAAVDIFSCGKQVDHWKAFHYLRKRLMATHFSAMEVKRGQLEERSEKVESLKVSQNLETL